MKRTAVIMAGGSGERFWPLSRKRRPKQLLKLLSEDKTMIEESISRISSLIAPEDVFIITSELLVEPMRESLVMIPPQNIVAEPYKRNTAPCLALAAAFIADRYNYLPLDQISIAVLTADQDISPEIDFVNTVAAALDYAENQKALLTIGIPPARPETGYGYIETESKFEDNHSAQILPVKSFREKPDLDTAKTFIESGNFLWNSGMFFWRLDTFIENMIECLPAVGINIAVMKGNLSGKTNDLHLSIEPLIGDVFEKFPNISIDYGLMEKANNVAVAKALFKWDDVGSWDALERVRVKDSENNIVHGAASIIDSKNSIIINESDNKIITACLGLDNMVVVVTKDAVMVCPKDRVQDVKKHVEDIRSRFGEEFL